jgi:hypothetical protein
VTRGTRPDPRITGLRPAARAAVTAWVLVLIPVLAATAGYLLLHLPAINRALWHAAVTRRAVTAAVRWTAGHPARRLLTILTATACGTTLALYWTAQGQFHGW